MDISSLAVRLIIIMLPGIVAALIVDNLTVHKPWDSFRFPLYSLLLGAFCYLLIQILLLIYGYFTATELTLKFWDAVVSDGKIVDFNEILAAIVCSLFLGVVVAAGINKKLFHRLAQRTGVTEKYGDESLFYFFLNSPNVTWVRIVVREEQKIYEGYRETFSDTDNVKEVLLRDVHVYRIEDSALLYQLDSVYISSKSDCFIIEQPR